MDNHGLLSWWIAVPAALGLLAVAACDGLVTSSSQSEPQADTVAFFTDHSLAYDEGPGLEENSLRLVVRDSVRWEEVWNESLTQQEADTVAPRIDDVFWA